MKIIKRFAFNVWDFESARAIIDAAKSLNQDVILQTSANIFKEIPQKSFSAYVKEYASSLGIHAWLNIDHCKEKDILFKAVDSGWDMIMADGSSMPVEENIVFTNEIISYAHAHDVLVEAEVGQVKGIEDDMVVQQNAIASKDDIRKFLSFVNVDFIAVAFGNAHGEYKTDPNLHYDLIEYTTSITDKPFVVHGGSGLSDHILTKLIHIPGIGKINISTDLKIAYKKGLEKAIDSWTQPISASDIIRGEIMKTAISKMKLISGGM